MCDSPAANLVAQTIEMLSRRAEERPFQNDLAQNDLSPDANSKIRTATAIDPDTTAIKTPGGSLDAGRAAALVHHLHPATGVGGAIMPPSIVRRTGDLAGWHWTIVVVVSCKHEIRTATAIDPDTTAIKAPGGTLYASSAAALIYHLHAATGVSATHMPLTIVGGASELSTAPGSGATLGPRTGTDEGNEDNGEENDPRFTF